MFDEVMTTLAMIERSPERAGELRETLRQLVFATVKTTESPETVELLQVVGFAEHTGFDVKPLIEALTDALSAILAKEDPNKPERSQTVRRQFQDFTGNRPEKVALPSAPPAGAVRLSAIAPPKRRFA